MTDNACKSTSDNGNKVGDTIVDKYALELQTTMKKERLNMARQAPDNKLCITQNAPLFGFITIYGLKSQVFDIYIKAECTDILQLHRK